MLALIPLEHTDRRTFRCSYSIKWTLGARMASYNI
jgi:hypothetical protein